MTLQQIQQRKRWRSRKAYRATQVLAAAALVLFPAVAGPAGAGGTDPHLLIHRAEAVSGSRFTSLEIRGAFPSEDWAQQNLGLQVVIWQPDGAFLRCTASAAWQGHSVALSDGATLEELSALTTRNDPSSDSAALSSLGSGRIELRLPADYVLSATRVVVMIPDSGSVVMSNIASVGVRP